MLRNETSDVEAMWCGVNSGERRDVREDEYAQLHRRLKRIVRARGALDVQEADALREAEHLRLWRHYGYSSLLEYMEIELGHTPRAALERLRVAKAIVELPAIADAMAQGDLSFSAGRELTRVATPETEQEWLEAAGDKNLRDLEDMVSGRKPGDKPTDPADPKLRSRRLRYDDIDDETVAMLRQAREILERECGEQLSDRQFLRTFARMVIDGAASPERTRAPYQMAVTVCEQCKRGWQDGGGITVEMSPATLKASLCDAVHIGWVGANATRRDDGDIGALGMSSRAEPNAPASEAEAGVSSRSEAGVSSRGEAGVSSRSEAGVSSRSEAGVSSRSEAAVSSRSEAGRAPATMPPSATRATSTIPPALRRKVKHRDHGRCRVPWCRSSRNCDQHHMKPLSLGGQHADDNLITLCESHHLAHHAGALAIEGTASRPVFKRRGHNAFATAERAVDTARALKELGFDKHEVKVAIEKTRTHVGTQELTLEHWIRLALSYCPKPRS